MWHMTSYNEWKKVEKIIRKFVISCYKCVTWMIIHVHKCHFRVKAFIWVKSGLIFFLGYRALGQVSWRSQIHEHRPQQLDCLNYICLIWLIRRNQNQYQTELLPRLKRGEVTHVSKCIWYSIYLGEIQFIINSMKLLWLSLLFIWLPWFSRTWKCDLSPNKVANIWK